MKKIFVCGLILLSILQTSEAQYSRYIIRFKDKATNPFSFANPTAFLSQRSIDRRTQYNIALDSTDLPVTPRYVDSIRLAGAVTILNVSKWLNSVTIQTTDAAALTKINSFPFVLSAAPIALKTQQGIKNKFKNGVQSAEQSTEDPPGSPASVLNITADYFDYGLSYDQVHIHNGEFLHNIGLRGQNMIIGMLDAGYLNYLTVKALDSIRNNGQILGTWDFVTRDASVNEDIAHGMQCLSVIAANIPGQFVGTAPKSSFYLFRSEDASTEYPIEEHNWACAAEKVDSAGGDVISSSLGYRDFDDNSFDYTFSDLDGNTTISAIAADLAAKKGILVVNSAGNEGNNSWGRIITPADGDSVMAVGAVTVTGVPASFTSRGPTSDGQVKPDVASVGVQTVVQHPNNVVGTANGTSFACPNMAGLATCLWQGFPEYNNYKIIKTLRQASHRFTNPNDTVGYGIPDVRKAVMILLKEFSTATAVFSNCITTVNWTSKDVAGMKYEIERRLNGQAGFIKIGEFNGSGSIFGEARNYQFLDTLDNAPAGPVIYRIKQLVDTNASPAVGDYIDTVTVNLSSSCSNTNGENVKMAPNPARNQLTLEVTTPVATAILIRMFNSQGQLVFEQNKNKTAGLAFFEIPIMNLASGKYYVSVFNGTNLMATKELIKLP